MFCTIRLFDTSGILCIATVAQKTYMYICCFAAMCCHLYCLWFSDEQAWWAETLNKLIIPGIMGFMTAYITAHGIPKSKAHNVL